MKLQRIANTLIYLAVYLLQLDAKALRRSSEYKMKASINMTRRAGELGAESVQGLNDSEATELTASSLNSFIKH